MVTMSALVSPICEQAGIWGYCQTRLERNFPPWFAVLGNCVQPYPRGQRHLGESPHDERGESDRAFVPFSSRVVWRDRQRLRADDPDQSGGHAVRALGGGGRF